MQSTRWGHGVLPARFKSGCSSFSWSRQSWLWRSSCCLSQLRCHCSISRESLLIWFRCILGSFNHNFSGGWDWIVCTVKAKMNPTGQKPRCDLCMVSTLSTSHKCFDRVLRNPSKCWAVAIHISNCCILVLNPNEARYHIDQTWQFPSTVSKFLGPRDSTHTCWVEEQNPPKFQPWIALWWCFLLTWHTL